MDIVDVNSFVSLSAVETGDNMGWGILAVIHMDQIM